MMELEQYHKSDKYKSFIEQRENALKGKSDSNQNR